jgi:hypothetical protein
MRRHFAYGSSLDPLSRSGTVTGSVTPGGAFASSLTSSGRTLSSGGTSRGTFTVPTLTADVYTPSGGTGAGYDTSRVYTFTGTGAGIDGFTPTQETTPDYLTFQPTLPTFTRSLAIRPGYTVPTRATVAAPIAPKAPARTTPPVVATGISRGTGKDERRGTSNESAIKVKECCC